MDAETHPASIPRWTGGLVIAVWAALVYANSFSGGFQLDDNHVILNNSRIQSFESFADIGRWTRLFFGRQLAWLSFAVNYRLHGYDLFGYHLFNLGVHIAASLGAYWLILLIHGTRAMAESREGRQVFWAALAGGLIFVSHPVQTQAVTYITQRMASMAALFYLAGVCLYARGRAVQLEEQSRRKAALFYAGVGGCFLLGLFSKATILSLPLALLLFEICFVRDGNNRLCTRFVAAYGIGLVLLAGLFLAVKGPIQLADAPPRWPYAMTEFRVLVTYLKLLFLPVDLVVLYDFPLSGSFLEGRTLASFLLLLCLGGAAALAFRRFRLLSFGILWFFVTLSVESSIVPLKYVIFEYRLYLPMLGFAVFLPAVLQRAPRAEGHFSWRTALLLIVLFFSVLTFRQNRLWVDGKKLWGDNVEKAPGSSEARHNLGFYYFMKGQYALSSKHFEAAIGLDPENFKAYNQRGLCYQMLGNEERALEDFGRAIELGKKATDALHNRASLLRSMGRLGEARADLERALSVRRRSPEVLADLGMVYSQLGENEKALAAFDRAIRLGKESAELHVRRGNVRLALGKVEGAAADYSRAIELDPDDGGTHNNLGIAHTRLGRFAEALAAFDRAIALDPDFADAHFNRAMTCLVLGEREKALASVERCLEIDPGHARAARLKEEIDGGKGKEVGR